MINLIQLFKDFDIEYSNEGKHGRPGWIQIHCPECPGSSDFHGGFNLQKFYYNCWRCGYHNKFKILSTILNKNYYEIKDLLKQYETHEIIRQKQLRIKKQIKHVELPLNSKYPNKRHFEYLLGRGFENPEKLIVEWGILGTDHLTEPMYKNRLVFPIHCNGQIVSFQTRDITGKSKLPYITCPEDKEVIKHKHILYGIDKIKNNRCVILEGVFDVLKFGIGSICTFGIGYKKEQVELLIKKGFEEIFILYDIEEQAQKQAKKLALDLKPFITYVEIISLKNGKKDVGEMSLKEIEKLREILNF